MTDSVTLGQGLTAWLKFPIPTSATTFADTTAMPGMTYYYVVRPALLDGTDVCQSNEASASPTAAPTTTSTPTGTPTQTPTATLVPEGGACADSAECESGPICVGSLCTALAAPVPVLSTIGFFFALATIAAIGGLSIFRHVLRMRR